MNQLNRAMYINLDSQPERHFYIRGLLTGMDCPLDSIARIPAKPGKDYPNKESICEAAAADGFPFLKDIWEKTHMCLPKLGLQWSWCGALREIASGDDITLLMVDHYILRKPYPVFQQLVGSITDVELNIVQVAQWYPHFDNNWLDGLMPSHLKDPWIPKVASPRYIRFYNEFLNYGFNGAGDGVTIYSPAGAKMMLEWLEDNPYFHPEYQIYRKSEKEVEGCFSVNYPHTWVGAIDSTLR